MEAGQESGSGGHNSKTEEGQFGDTVLEQGGEKGKGGDGDAGGDDGGGLEQSEIVGLDEVKKTGKRGTEEEVMIDGSVGGGEDSELLEIIPSC